MTTYPVFNLFFGRRWRGGFFIFVRSTASGRLFGAASMEFPD
jgi:hypothetical protein